MLGEQLSNNYMRWMHAQDIPSLLWPVRAADADVSLHDSSVHSATC
jgi:hypothetical protein